MGLCKCPKRKVTNQFCFEHRVNVCEYCMVANHPKCIIQSYLQWLQDSDYNPICEICTKSLVEDECIRLTCYHVFHWSCAEARYRALPRTTAPAGYQCPTCNTPVFPPPNLVSPVADVLKERLAGVNWARAGLGLPLLSEDQDLQGASSRRSISPNAYYMNGLNESRASPVGASDDESTESKHSIVNIGDDQVNLFDNVSTKRTDLQNHMRKHKSLDLGNTFDHDDNKYKQKSAFSFLNRWWNNRLPPARLSRPGSVIRRYWLLILVLITVAGILYLLSMREVEDSSPFGNNGMGNQRVLQKN